MNPLFFDRRVYQGSSGKVYPVPFIDKVFDTPAPKAYDAVRLENAYLRLVMLPEIGGRIFLGQDKVNQDYDFFYKQDVIKPALVGLAGPWLSGGVEFNWPQHHRPGTYLPTDVHIESEDNGAVTVWMSEHDPIDRLKGMHGIRMSPDSALVELRARLYNRTPLTQTFLWWANVAAEVHDNYQSFFPPDVHYVADHAVRAQTSFPVAIGDYYGVDYGERPGANDLTRYKNIPVPTSYMVCDTRFGFFGGYDHDAGGGFVHVADRHLSPGKKQWTWGNHEFGWAWDRELTDRVGPTGRPAPYVELMAGVYTDNQPDFSYLQPYETKTFSQYWWPYQKIGPVQNATKDAAVRLVANDDGTLDLGAVASRRLAGVSIILKDVETGEHLIDACVDLAPDSPWHCPSFKLQVQHEKYRLPDSPKSRVDSLRLSVGEYVSYQPILVNMSERKRAVATEPPSPEACDTVEQLYLTAEHLEQYRHPTRDAEAYLDEALKRDPKDARVNIAYGRRKLKAGCFAQAQRCFETAIERLTHRHPNPCTGEAHYFLGVAMRFLGCYEQAYAAFYKATWDYAWRSASYFQLATLDCCSGDFVKAIEHCRSSLETNQKHSKAKAVMVLAMKASGQNPEDLVKAVLAEDPLDHLTRWAAGDVDGFLKKTRNDAQTVLDVAYDLTDAGFVDHAIELIECHHTHEVLSVAVPNPMERSQITHYALAWMKQDRSVLDQARLKDPAYCFPSRLHDQVVLEWARSCPGADRNASFGLGNYFYDRRRYEEAIGAWEEARKADADCATVHRNLGIAYWNVRRDGPAARASYLSAQACAPSDARLLVEFDQLCEKLGDAASDRLRYLEWKRELVDERDDCTVALADLYNQTGLPDLALELILARRFHPWEGGEGKVLRQYTTAHLKLGQQALSANDAALALDHFNQATQPPINLGEAYHMLQAKADVLYWRGMALRLLGREDEAVDRFQASANEQGDFLAMAVAEHSELSYFRGLSLFELGRVSDAESLFCDLEAFARREADKPAVIDYFATSLPLLLVFEDDLDAVRKQQMDHLMALAEQGLRSIGHAKADC